MDRAQSELVFPNQLAMFATLAPGLHQPCPPASLFHPGVTQVDVVFAVQLLVKVPHVEVKVLLLVQAQHGLHCLERHPLRRGNATTAIEQSLISFMLGSAPSNAASAGN